jgi:hypothetical protein
MADEGLPEEELEQEEELAEEAEELEAPQAPQGQQQVRLNFEGVSPEYANFCTLTVRQGEVFLNFGKAFVPGNELKVDSQIVMSLRNVQQLHQAIGRLLEQQAGQGD